MISSANGAQTDIKINKLVVNLFFELQKVIKNKKHFLSRVIRRFFEQVNKFKSVYAIICFQKFYDSLKSMKGIKNKKKWPFIKYDGDSKITAKHNLIHFHLTHKKNK